MTQRIKRHPFLALFDGADPNASTPGVRHTTTVPTQALFFLTTPSFTAAPQSWPAVLCSSPMSRPDRLACAPACDGRPPTVEASQPAAATAAGRELPAQAASPVVAWPPGCAVMLAATNSFTWIEGCPDGITTRGLRSCAAAASFARPSPARS